jgi:hypothetical protein
VKVVLASGDNAVSFNDDWSSSEDFRRLFLSLELAERKTVKHHPG